ncbi:MAG: hypothetical protein KDD56_06760, partial [Bdellovibrionales bacterium]|nr:hypothetical protein [Bdellovibrionales bacterium]
MNITHGHGTNGSNEDPLLKILGATEKSAKSLKKIKTEVNKAIRSLKPGEKIFFGKTGLGVQSSVETPIEISIVDGNFCLNTTEEKISKDWPSFVDEEIEIIFHQGEKIPPGTIVRTEWGFELELPFFSQLKEEAANKVIYAGGAEGQTTITEGQKAISVASLTGILEEASKENNEDSVSARLAEGGGVFACVADGVGGEAFGEIASRSLIIQLNKLREMGQTSFEIQKKLDLMVAEDLENGEFKLTIEAATTMASFMVIDRFDLLETYHVGDSKIFVCRPGQKIPVFQTISHNFAEEIFAKTKIPSVFIEVVRELFLEDLEEKLKQEQANINSDQLRSSAIEEFEKFKIKNPSFFDLQNLLKHGVEEIDQKFRKYFEQSLKLVEPLIVQQELTAYGSLLT